MAPFVSIAVTGLLLLCPIAALSQTSDPQIAAMKEELEALKAGQLAIQKELQEIKALLKGNNPEAPEVEPDREVAVAGAPSKGDPGAKVTIIEFSDFQCPFCARHVQQTAARIEDTYVKRGQVRYVFRHFPIEAIHPLALGAHEAAACAIEQGKFWEMHNRLFSQQDALEPGDLSKHAASLGLSVSSFQACIDSGRSLARIRQDVAEGRSVGVTGTPMFFIGLTEPNEGKVKVVRSIRGAQSFALFQQAIDSVLAATQ